MRTLELEDGQIIAEYDPETGEVTSVEDWHGNEASDRWYLIACEKVQELMCEEAEAKRELRDDR